MTRISAKRHENAAYWFADTDRELRRVVWLDPAYGGNAGRTERGNVVLQFQHRDPRVARENADGEGMQQRDIGYAPDLETADKLAREALTALAIERGDQKATLA